MNPDQNPSALNFNTNDLNVSSLESSIKGKQNNLQNSNINIAERSAFRNHYSINIELSTNSFSSKLLAKNTNLKENCNFIINN